MVENINKILVFLFIIISTVVGQNTNVKTNTIYLEIGGNCVWYSINYEKEFIGDISPRIGISLMPISGISNFGRKSDYQLIATLIANHFFDLNTKSKIELGFGFAYCLGNVFPTTTFGYRYSPNDGGFIFKIAFTPLLDQKLFAVFPWFGIGLGFRF